MTAPASTLTASLPILSALTPPTPAMLAQLAEINQLILACPQIELTTDHLFHGGMYARTIRLTSDVKMMGSLIKLATILIIHGDCSVLIGEERVELTGYNVIPGCAGRKQLFWTHGPVEMTMLYPTSVQNVAEAEDEIFAESDQLLSRRDGSRDTVTITGQ
jgi:hypothetical protein